MEILIIKHNIILVAKGFSQFEGIEYTNNFSLVAKMNSICLILALATSYKWEVHHMDVNSAFFHGDLQGKIYMEKPHMCIHNDSSFVCNLKKFIIFFSVILPKSVSYQDNFRIVNIKGKH